MSASHIQGHTWEDATAQQRIIALFEALPASPCGACGAEGVAVTFGLDGRTYDAACSNDSCATPVYAPVTPEQWAEAQDFQARMIAARKEHERNG